MLVCLNARLGDQKVVYDPELFLGNAIFVGLLGYELHKLQSGINLSMMGILSALQE